MRVPKVVVVGRPNVGKSSVFNWLARRRLAIVDDVAGVTRDRVTHLIEEDGRMFEIIDTGGIGINDVDDLSEEIEEQIEIGIQLADLILFVVDAQTGRTPLDIEVARRLRAINKPIICVVNKCDSEKLLDEKSEFYQLAQGSLIATSVVANRNRRELLDKILETIPETMDEDFEDVSEPTMKVAIVGRRNVGKSTFINSLVNEERMIVSEVPGTTRDSVDVQFELDGKSFIAIDTPGMKRGRSIKSNVDYYSTHRAQRSIRRADVVLIFFDAGQRIGKVDKQLCSYVAENYKPCIFVVNKWDKMVDHMPTERWSEYIRETFSNMWNAPIAFTTGLTGRNTKTLMNHAQMLYKQSRMRISTGVLNRLLRAAIDRNPPPLYHQHRPKLFYATQTGTEPPTVVLFCNNPKWFSLTYRKYLLGVLRDQLEFGEVPIKLYLNKREQSDSRDEIDATMEQTVESKENL